MLTVCTGIGAGSGIKVASAILAVIAGASSIVALFESVVPGCESTSVILTVKPMTLLLMSLCCGDLPDTEYRGRIPLL